MNADELDAIAAREFEKMLYLPIGSAEYEAQKEIWLEAEDACTEILRST